MRFVSIVGRHFHSLLTFRLFLVCLSLVGLAAIAMMADGELWSYAKALVDDAYAYMTYMSSPTADPNAPPILGTTSAFVALIAVIALSTTGTWAWQLFLAGYFDRARIRNDSVKKGWTVRSIRRAAIGPGWFRERKARIYRVRIADDQVESKVTHCKTSACAGVHWCH